MGAAAAMSPVTAAVGIVIEADAQHYDEWTDTGGTVTSEDTVGVNRGTIDDNYGTVATNVGTISINHSGGTVTTNASGGTVTDNYGRVDADFGLVGTNYSGGSVFVNSGGELGVNSGGSVAFESGAKLLLNTTDGITISGYTVENNSGTSVYVNNGGTIENNSGPGVTVNSGGTIVNNYGSSATVNSGGTIENNSGTLVTVNSGGRLVTNNGSGVTNNAGGTIVTNNGINVMNAGGSIEFNNGEVTNTSGGTVGNNLKGATVSGGIIGNNYGSAIDVNEVTNNWAGGSVTGDDSIVINNYGGSVSNQENIQNSYPANPGPMYPVQPAAPSDRNGETLKAAEPVQSLGSPGTITSGGSAVDTSPSETGTASGGIQVSVNPAVTLQNKISDIINSQLKGVAGSKTGGIMAAGQVLTAHVDMGQQSNFTSEMIGVLQSATDQNIAVVMAVKYKGNELELTIQPHSDLSGVQAYLQQSGEKVAGVMCVHALTPQSTLTNNTTNETHTNNMSDSDIPDAVARAVKSVQQIHFAGGNVSATGISDAN